MISAISDVSEEQNQSLEWGIANAFIQDVIAINSFSSDVIPCHFSNVANGYKILNAFSSGGEVMPPGGFLERKLNINEHLLDEVNELVLYLNQWDEMSWKDAIEINQKMGKEIIIFIEYCRLYNTKFLKENTLEIYDQRVKVGHEVLDLALSGLREVAAAILGSPRFGTTLKIPSYRNKKQLKFLFEAPAFKMR